MIMKVEIIGLIKKGVRLTFTRTTKVVFFLFKFAKYLYSSIISMIFGAVISRKIKACLLHILRFMVIPKMRLKN